MKPLILVEILNDFSISVKKALKEIDPNYENYKGLVICGTHLPHDVEVMIDKIRQARETGLPFYGECFGHQLSAIEYARNVLGIKDATSGEFGQGTFVVKKLPKLNVGIKKVGDRYESFWNNYEVDLLDWEKPDNFFTAQFHASYQSSINNKHPLIVSFLQYAKEYTMVL